MRLFGEHSSGAFRRSVANPAAPILERVSVPLRNEFPVVSLRVEDKLDYSVRAVVSDLAIGKNRFGVAVMTSPPVPTTNSRIPN